MTQKNLLALSIVAGTAALMSAGSAQALIINGLKITTEVDTPFSTVEGAQTITFDDAAPTLNSAGRLNLRTNTYTHSSGVSYHGRGGHLVTDSKSGRYAAPPSQGEYDNTFNPYLSVGSYNTAELVIDFGVESDYFGFYFGSIDTYNNLHFYNGDELIASLTGEHIRTEADGDQSTTGARFVNIFAQEGQNFDKIVFQSDNRAFESDNHAYRVADPVPTPAAVLPILSGLFASAKRRKQTDAE